MWLLKIGQHHLSTGRRRRTPNQAGLLPETPYAPAAAATPFGWRHSHAGLEAAAEGGNVFVADALRRLGEAEAVVGEGGRRGSSPVGGVLHDAAAHLLMESAP